LYPVGAPKTRLYHVYLGQEVEHLTANPYLVEVFEELYNTINQSLDQNQCLILRLHCKK
jgi:hypothetical protein